jgi:hypothetical protein
VEYTYFQGVFFAVFRASLALMFFHCRHSNSSFHSSRRKPGTEDKGGKVDIRTGNTEGISLERALE